MILLWRFLVLRTPVYWRREHRERTAETWNAVRKTMIVDLRASSSLDLRQVMKKTGSMTGWWVASLCPSASTIQSSQTARFRYDSE